MTKTKTPTEPIATWYRPVRFRWKTGPHIEATPVYSIAEKTVVTPWSKSSRPARTTIDAKEGPWPTFAECKAAMLRQRKADIEHWRERIAQTERDLAEIEAEQEPQP